MRISIIQKDDTFPVTNWVLGKVYYNGHEYEFVSKAFEESSNYGIEKGCISSLWVKNKSKSQVVFNYDRGYDKDYSYSMTKIEPIKSIIQQVTMYVKNYGRPMVKRIQISKYSSGLFSVVLFTDTNVRQTVDWPIFIKYSKLKELVYDEVGYKLPPEKELVYTVGADKIKVSTIELNPCILI